MSYRNELYDLLSGNPMDVVMKKIGSLINNSNSEVRLKVLHAVAEMIYIPVNQVSVNSKCVWNDYVRCFQLLLLVRRWWTTSNSWEMADHDKSKTYSIHNEFDETTL